QRLAKQNLCFPNSAGLAESDSQVVERIEGRRMFRPQQFAPDGEGLTVKRLGFNRSPLPCDDGGQVIERVCRLRMLTPKNLFSDCQRLSMQRFSLSELIVVKHVPQDVEQRRHLLVIVAENLPHHSERLAE